MGSAPPDLRASVLAVLPIRAGRPAGAAAARSLRRSGRQLLVRRRHRQLHALRARASERRLRLPVSRRSAAAEHGLAFVACSGATTSSLMANQIQAVTATTSFVSVTIGGNDIGFADLIYQCTLGDCSSALDSTPGVARDRAQQSARHRLHRDQEPGGRRERGRARLSADVLERRLLRHARDQLDGAHEGKPTRGGSRHRGRRCRRLRSSTCRRARLVLDLRGLLVEPVAERAEPVQHGRELPPNRNGNSLGYAPPAALIR